MHTRQFLTRLLLAPAAALANTVILDGEPVPVSNLASMDTPLFDAVFQPGASVPDADRDGNAALLAALRKMTALYIEGHQLSYGVDDVSALTQRLAGRARASSPPPGYPGGGDIFEQRNTWRRNLGSDILGAVVGTSTSGSSRSGSRGSSSAAAAAAGAADFMTALEAWGYDQQQASLDPVMGFIQGELPAGAGVTQRVTDMAGENGVPPEIRRRLERGQPAYLTNSDLVSSRRLAETATPFISASLDLLGVPGGRDGSALAADLPAYRRDRVLVVGLGRGFSPAAGAFAPQEVDEREVLHLWGSRFRVLGFDEALSRGGPGHQYPYDMNVLRRSHRYIDTIIYTTQVTGIELPNAARTNAILRRLRAVGADFTAMGI